MNITIDSINTIADCDTLLANVNAFKKQFELKLDLLRYEMAESFANAEDIESTIDLTEAQIVQLKQSIPNLPLGELRTQKELNLLNLRQKLKSLEKLEREGNAIAKYLRQFEINILEANINIANICILSLARRKSALSKYPDIAA